MPGPLTHSPADVLAIVLIQLGAVQSNTPPVDWSVFVSLEPDEPEKCITLYDDAGVIDGRTMPDAEVQEHHGVQVRVRSNEHASGYLKARAIATALAAQYDTVVVLEGHYYRLHCSNRSGDVIPIPPNTSTSRRLFTINYLLSLREIGV